MVAARNGNIELAACRGQLDVCDAKRLGGVSEGLRPYQGVQLFASNLMSSRGGLVDGAYLKAEGWT